MGRYQEAASLADLSTPGLVVADLGCGTGRLVAALLAEQYPPSRVQALDHASELDDDLLTDERVRSVISDLDEPLPLADLSVDRVFSINTAEHLLDPVHHLLEMHRVLRPGGRAVLVHSDWDTMLFSGGDDQLTRRLVDRFVAAMPTWISRADGFMGRRLLRLPALAKARGARFSSMQVHSWADAHRRFDDDSLGHKLAIGIAMAGAADAELAPAIAGWLDSLERASAAGEFLFCVTDVAVVLEK